MYEKIKNNSIFLNTPDILIKPKKYEELFLSEEHCHDAGFDSYMTGYIFLNYICYYESSPKLFIKETLLDLPRKENSIIEYRNKIRVYHLESLDLEDKTTLKEPEDIVLLELNYPVYHYMKIGELKDVIEKYLNIKVSFSQLSFKYFLFNVKTKSNAELLIKNSNKCICYFI